MAKLRPLGHITSDLELLLEEMTDQHEMQNGEILALVYNWLKVHAPQATEVYEDDTNPEFYYGPRKV